MKNHPLLIAAWLLLLAAGSAPGQAPPAPEGRSYFGGALSLRLPADWQVREADDQTLTLTPPQGEAIEVLSWPVPRGAEASARAAAAAHESALFERLPYRRVSATPVKPGGGQDGLLVTGLMLQEDGRTVRTVFAAFAGGDRYFVFGLQTAPREGETDPALGDMLAWAELAPAAAAEPKPPTNGTAVAAQPAPVEPPAQPVMTPAAPAPGPAAPLPATPPAPLPTPSPPAEPVLTPPQPPAPSPTAAPAPTPAAPLPQLPEQKPTPPPQAAMVRYASPLGFTLEHPANWPVAVVKGHIEVTAPGAAGSETPAALALIWPLAQLQAGQDPAALARDLLAHVPLVGDRAADLRARTDEGVAVLAGEVGPPETPWRLVACAFVQRDQGLLTALVVRPEDFAGALPGLLHVLGTFSGGPWWADLPSSGGAVWQDPVEDRLRVPVPDGWRIEGQVRRRGEGWRIQLDLSSSDGRMWCRWRQPVQPLFRDFTPVLRNLGWQEGDRYPANAKDSDLKILARLKPQDFLTLYWLRDIANRLGSVVLDEMNVSPAVAGMAGGENPAGVVATLHGRSPSGERQRVCLMATSDAPDTGEPNCWQAAALEAEGPLGAALEAMAALRAAVEGATVTDGAPGGLRNMLAAARRALTAAPETAPTENPPAPAQAGVAHADVLTIRNDEGRGRLWLQSAAALAPWQQARQTLGRGESVGGAMPELDADYWK